MVSHRCGASSPLCLARRCIPEPRVITTMLHILKTEMTLPLPRQKVFAFFAEAKNLELITPPEFRFKILTPLPFEIQENALIDYVLSLYGMRFHWHSRITCWNPPYGFVDE